MAIDGTFMQFSGVAYAGVVRTIWSLRIANTSLLGSEDVQLMLSDRLGSQQQQLRFTLRARQSEQIDVRTVGWDWCRGDYAALLHGNRIRTRWDFPPPMETCPECHGSHRCLRCGGTGRFMIGGEQFVCRACGGSGICQRCFVPERNHGNAGFTSPQTPVAQQQTTTERRRGRPRAVILGDIKKTERELEDLRYDHWQRTEIRKDFNSYTMFQANQKVELEYRLKRLYAELAEAER